MKRTHCASIDLGATSGRVIVGTYSEEGLELTEVHRFPNGFRELGRHAYWEVGALFDEVKKGLLEAKRVFPELESCGVDTWGVDHVLLDKRGRLVFPTHAYRDERTEPIMKKLQASGQDKLLYEWTGMPILSYNTGLQLMESVTAFPQLREMVDRVLFLPDYINYLLSGSMANEISIASTGQLLDVKTRDFSKQALDFLGIPERWLEKPTLAGHRMGRVNASPDLDGVELILTPGHDTSCAFEAIPQSGNALLVSAGTWLLIGGLTQQPAMGDLAYKSGVANERDGQGGYRPNKTILGLWLLEQTMRTFDTQPKGEAEWSALVQAAEDEPPVEVFIDTTDRALFNPADMRAAIDANLKRQKTTPPSTLAGYTRLICDSLGRSVAQSAQSFAEMTGTAFDSIAIVGGGSRNRLLCQRIADFSGWQVVSYSLEGTTVGNIAYQLLGTGHVPDLDAFRRSIEPKLSRQLYEPKS